MSLLTEVMQRPLDPGYAAAARRRAERAAAGAPAPRRAPAAAATTVLAALLGVLVVVAWLQAAGRRPEVDRGREELLQRVRAQTAAVEELARSSARLRAGNQRLQEQLAGAAAAADARAAGALAPAVGAAPVRGPGIEVELSDAPEDPLGGAVGDPRADAAPVEGRVLDRDLQVLVNGLWAAGAEAVAVDGQRLTALSAIRSAGAAVLVDYRPLVPPYTVRAVGDPSGLQTGLAASTAGSYLRALEDNYGIGVVVREAELELPAAASVELDVARVAVPSPQVRTPEEGSS